MPNSARFKKPSKLVTVVFSPNTSIPKCAIKACREKKLNKKLRA